MSDLVIFGAGGFGREILAYAEEAGMTVAGFVDDNPTAVDGFDLPVGILGSVADVDIARYDWVVAFGDAVLRRRVHRSLALAGAMFRTVAHPSAYVARTARVGDGCILCPFSLVAAHSTLEADVALNTYASVGHDATVGAHSVLSPYAVVNGNVTLGEAVFLGTGAIVTPGRSVGRDTKVNVLTAVSRDVEPGSLVAGNPMRSRVMFPVDEA